jgi:ketosteroid isomerase-like protein
MSTAENREIVRRLYDAGSAGDMDAIAALVADNVLLVQSDGHATVVGALVNSPLDSGVLQRLGVRLPRQILTQLVTTLVSDEFAMLLIRVDRPAHR